MQPTRRGRWIWRSTASPWALAAATRRAAGTRVRLGGRTPGPASCLPAGTRSGCREIASFPHLVSLRFESSAAFPQGWQLHRPNAKPLPAAPPSAAPIRSPTPDPAAVRLAVKDLMVSFGDRYRHGAEYLRRLDDLEQRLAQAKGVAEQVGWLQKELADLQREALLANPLLDFDKLLLVKRGETSPALGLPQNWQSNSSLPKTGYDDSIEVLSPVSPDGQLTTLYQPAGGRFVGDVDLHFDAGRLLFSMPGDNGRWQVFEIAHRRHAACGSSPASSPTWTATTPAICPTARSCSRSTACFKAVPCTGSTHVAVLYVMDADGQNIRQLCFDQDHDWCPTVLNNGRVLYTRWEYTDTAHCHTRLLFHMNPDGTEQMEYLGSNSYWPNAFFYARPIPGHPTKVVAVISGHHGVPRMGELVIFDPARGRHEADRRGAADSRLRQEGRAVMKDQLADASWPKFLHPYPLEREVLPRGRPSPRRKSLWGIYLVDVFDNMVLVKELPGYALLEPIPLRKTPRPPVIPEKVDLARKTPPSTSPTSTPARA